MKHRIHGRAMGAHKRIALVAASFSVLLLASGAFASEQLAESQNLVCTVCHDKPGSKLLTDKGKYFELMRSMDGYAELEASFGSCTFCHRRKPGSTKLTKAGKGFANAMGGMQALVEWVEELHPAWPESEIPEQAPLDEETGATAPEADAPKMMPAH